MKNILKLFVTFGSFYLQKIHNYTRLIFGGLFVKSGLQKSAKGVLWRYPNWFYEYFPGLVKRILDGTHRGNCVRLKAKLSDENTMNILG